MNSRILISPSLARGFQPILSGKTWWLRLSLDCEFKEIILLNNVWKQASSISLIRWGLLSRVS
ncbi:hypothetical protein [Microcoleus sp. herbarium12]|uniref:hypothetical protein n=1 Tax=Microcoleus sp. herbarium12 TaxID=3055437 RepID=UPI002FD27B4F